MSIILLLFVLLVFILLSHLLSPKPDPREPPILAPRIPIIGHLIGFLRYRIFYLEQLAARCPYPIFSLQIFNYKIHVITDPDLLSAMHRHSSPSFDPMIIAIAESIVGDSPNILKLMHAPPDSSTGRNEYMVDTHNSLHTSMFPGPGLWEMNARVLEKVAEMVNVIDSEFEERNLWYWLRDSFTMATSEALFGVHHPLAKHPSLVQAAWDSDESQITSIFLHKAMHYLPHALRRLLLPSLKIRTAFQTFYSSPSSYLHPSVSSLVNARMNANLKHSIPIHETGNSAHSLLFVATTNAVPTIFWSILYLFSNPELVEELRIHLENSGVVSEVGRSGDGDGKKRRLRIDYTQFVQKCPKLVNAYNEVMRLTNLQSGARLTTSDFCISAKDNEKPYLLKANTLLLAPSRIPHLSPSIWGAHAKEFDPKRWENLSKVQKKAFVPFGGGKHLCPGREFAFAEIVGCMAVLVLGFEIVGLGGGKDGDGVSGDLNGEGGNLKGARLKVPEGRVMKVGVAGPDRVGKLMRVRIKRRVGWDGVVWSFGRGGGEWEGKDWVERKGGWWNWGIEGV